MKSMVGCHKEPEIKAVPESAVAVATVLSLDYDPVFDFDGGTQQPPSETALL